MAFTKKTKKLALYLYIEKGIPAKDVYCIISRAIAERGNGGANTWADDLLDDRAPSPSTIHRWADEATKPSWLDDYKKDVKRKEVVWKIRTTLIVKGYKEMIKCRLNNP